jgi:hypothetical protein
MTFEAKICRPVESGGDDTWAFCDLPADISEQLPSRGQVAVNLTLNGVELLTVLQPNGIGGHWLKIDSKFQQQTSVKPGEIVEIHLSPSKVWPDPEVPADFMIELEASRPALTTWTAITTAARTDWIFWLESAKKSETRQKRIGAACDMLANGKRRVCCFDRSGMYSKSLTGPVARD